MSSRRLLRRNFRLLAATVTIAVIHSASLAVAGVEAPCSRFTFEGAPFTMCVADPRRDRIRLFLNRPDGTLYGALSELPQDGLVFATNAGMFTPELAPAGLFIQGGKTLKPLNTVVAGYGNFHMQPNGVFWIRDGKAAVTPTQKFAKLKPDADLATQSGPMLVIDNTVNPKFEENGASRYVRNGVGVDDNGHVVVAISDTPVSFGRFGRLFRNALKCPNALYLDGSISALRIAGEPVRGGGGTLGPLLGVYAKER